MIDEIFVNIRWNLDFTGSNYDPRIRKMRASDEWEKRRLEIWEKYSMPSLVNQTISSFRVLMLCDFRFGGMIDRLEKTFPDKRFNIVTNWDGIRKSIHEGGDKNDRLMFCRMDSDDMYHPALIERFIKAVFEMDKVGREFIQAMNGYCLNVSGNRDQGKVYQWGNPSPPFFCIVRERGDLLKDFPGGSGIAHHGRLGSRAYHMGGDPAFCVTLNGMNICNRVTVPWRGKEVTGSELQKMKADYRI